MIREFDTTQPLHIFINEDPVEPEKDNNGGKVKSFSELLEKFNIEHKIEIGYHVDDLLLYLGLFPDDLQVYIWIHPSIKQTMSDPEHLYPPLILANTLKQKHPEISFNLISRHANLASSELSNNYHVFPITILNSLMEGNILPQRIGTMRTNRNVRMSAKTNASSYQVDYAIITALHDDEFTNVCDVLGLEESLEIKLGGKTVFSGKSSSGANIIATYQSEAGKTDAGILATEIISTFSPRFLIMPGVCGGSPKTEYGDIIIAKFIFTIDKGKITDDRFFNELEVSKINDIVIRKIKESDVKILKEVKKELIGSNYAQRFVDFSFQNLKSYIEPMACSSYVIDKNNYFADVITRIDRKTAAVEMESYAIARAAELADCRTKAVIVKSVMDKTVDKVDLAKEYASVTSSLYIKYLIEKNVLL